jgi:hypothetical protein
MANVQAIAERAASYDPIRFVLTVLAIPFYVVGAALAVLWLCGTWVIAAGRTGFDDARRRAGAGADG